MSLSSNLKKVIEKEKVRIEKHLGNLIIQERYHNFRDEILSLENNKYIKINELKLIKDLKCKFGIDYSSAMILLFDENLTSEEVFELINHHNLHFFLQNPILDFLILENPRLLNKIFSGLSIVCLIDIITHNINWIDMFLEEVNSSDERVIVSFINCITYEYLNEDLLLLSIDYINRYLKKSKDKYKQTKTNVHSYNEAKERIINDLIPVLFKINKDLIMLVDL